MTSPHSGPAPTQSQALATFALDLQTEASFVDSGGVGVAGKRLAWRTSGQESHDAWRPHRVQLFATNRSDIAKQELGTFVIGFVRILARWVHVDSSNHANPLGRKATRKATDTAKEVNPFNARDIDQVRTEFG